LVFGSIANGRYELAIMLPKKDEDSANIFVLGLIVNTSFSFFLLLILLILGNYAASLLNSARFPFWLYFVPFSVSLIGLFNLLSYFANRFRRYKDLVVVNLYKTAGMLGVQIALGILKIGVLGLISGQILSQIISNVKLFFTIKKLGLFSKLDKRVVLGFARKYKSFILISSPAAFADTLTLQFPYIFLSVIYSNEIAGSFFLAMRMVFLPSSLMSSSISRVYLERITRLSRNNKPIFFTVKSVGTRIFLISIPVFLFFFTLSPTLFPIIFGEEWKLAGRIAQILSFIFVIRFVTSTLSSIFTLHEYVKVGSFWQATYFVTSVILFSFTYVFRLDFFIFIYFYVLHEIILYLFYLYLIFYIARKHDKSLLEEQNVWNKWNNQQKGHK